MVSDYKGLDVINAVGDGGILVIDDFKEMADRAGQVHQTTGAPTVNDDSDGTAANGAFNVWSKWHNTTTDDIYICVDSTPTAAEWVRITSDAAGVGSIDGVSNSGGNVDFVEGSNITITPDNGLKRIIFSLNTSTDISFANDNVGTKYGTDDDARIRWDGANLVIDTENNPLSLGGVISVFGTTDYENNVTHDDDIPNKKYVDDAVTTAAVSATVTPVTNGISTPYAIASSEGGSIFTNEGALATAGCRLPTAITGLLYQFICQNSNGIRVTCRAGETIRFGDTASIAQGYIESSITGSVLTLICINSTQWFIVNAMGSWQVETS